MIKRITEVGATVHDRRTAVKKFVDLFEGETSGLKASKNYPLTYEMVRLGNIDFEIMEPVDQSSFITKFLKKHGEGLHHIAFEVADIDSSIEWLRQKGIGIINSKPLNVGHLNLRAIFLTPISFKGVLIELVEGDPAWIKGQNLPIHLKTQFNTDSFGIEGILEVGIRVDDSEAASATYSNVFSGKRSCILDDRKNSLRMEKVRVGNVDLKLMEMGEEGYLRGFAANNGMGLHHITMKVRNLEHSAACLSRQGISYIADPLTSACPSKAIFIDPRVLSGVLLRITEEEHGRYAPQQ